MLKIKLSRFGQKNQAHYRIIVAEARSKRDGSSIDTLGHYTPQTNPAILKIDMEKYQEWISKGAQPTQTVKSLAQKANGSELTKLPKKPKKKKSKKNEKKS